MKWILKLDSMSSYTRHAVSTAILSEKNSVLYLKQTKEVLLWWKCVCMCVCVPVCSCVCLCARVFVYVGCSPWNSKACPEFFTAPLHTVKLSSDDSIIQVWSYFEPPSIHLLFKQTSLCMTESQETVPMYWNLLDSAVTTTHKKANCIKDWN